MGFSECVLPKVGMVVQPKTSPRARADAQLRKQIEDIHTTSRGGLPEFRRMPGWDKQRGGAKPFFGLKIAVARFAWQRCWEVARCKEFMAG